MLKHGAYQSELGGDTAYFWMGEAVSQLDFNGRLREQTKSLLKEADMIQVGMDLQEMIEKGQQIDKDLSVLEKAFKEILALPLCSSCKERITVWGRTPL